MGEIKPMARRTGLFAGVIFALFLSGCSSGPQQTIMPTAAPTWNESEPTKTPPPPVSPTNEILPTPTITITLQPSSTPTTMPSEVLDSFSWDGQLIFDGTDNVIYDEYWSEGGETLYYGVTGEDTSPNDVSWYAYSLKTNEVIPTKTHYDQLEEILRNLDIPGIPDLPSSLFDGTISNQGNRVIYRVQHGEDCFSNQIKSYIIIQDPLTSAVIFSRLIPMCMSLLNAFWIDNGQTVLYAHCWEGPCQIYVFNENTYQLNRLETLTGENIVTDQEWSVDPTGSTMAISNADDHYRFTLVDLHQWNISHTNEIGVDLSWSSDGKYLFYWGGFDLMNAFESNEIRALDIESGKSQVVITKAEILAALPGFVLPPGLSFLEANAPFAVSPNRNSIAIWDFAENLWLLEKAN